MQIAGFIFWVGICYLVAWAGAQVSPGIVSSDWYDALNKPSWNPPGWIFGPVWTLLYTLMGISAWQIWRKYDFSEAKFSLSFFLIQLALNGLWSQLFFGLQNPGAAFFEIIILLITIIITTALFFQKQKTAGWLMLPYILWVGFATLLNGAIWMIN